MGSLPIRCCLLLATHALALRVQPSFIRRREILSLAALAPALPVRAGAEGGVLWELELPPSFSVSRRLASIVRSRVETMLAAEDTVSGVQARLLLIPLGQQAAGSLSADDQLLLASHFLGGSDGGDAQDVARVMSTSTARSPSVVSVERIGAARERTDTNGRCYVSFS